MYGLSFDKINVIIACCKDIYCRHFLVLEEFITCLPPEKPHDITFIPSVLKCMQRWQVS